MGVGDFSIPWQGNWEHVYLPAHLFVPVNCVDPDPTMPVPWQNQFGGTYYWEMRGLTFYHPTGTHARDQCADYDLLGPPQIEQEIFPNRIRDLALSLVWWCSGNSETNRVLWRADVGAFENDRVLGGVMQSVYWSSGGKPNRVIVCPAQVVSAPQKHLPESLYHLRVARKFSGGGYMDTYLYEAFLIGVVLHVRLV